MINAKKELIEHIAGRKVKHIRIQYKQKIIEGSLAKVLKSLNFTYDNGYGGQELPGNIWYEDGTWSERGEYDGSGWWVYKACPPIPNIKKT